MTRRGTGADPMHRVADVVLDGDPMQVWDYLVEPRNRPQWQASLRAVTVRDPGAPHVGQGWQDRTWVGLVARMHTTALEPGRVFGERGAWRTVTADLVLRLAATAPAGTRVMAQARLAVAGRPIPGRLTRLLLGPAIRADLVRAGKEIAVRDTGGAGGR